MPDDSPLWFAPVARGERVADRARRAARVFTVLGGLVLAFAVVGNAMRQFDLSIGPLNEGFHVRGLTRAALSDFLLGITAPCAFAAGIEIAAFALRSAAAALDLDVVRAHEGAGR